MGDVLAGRVIAQSLVRVHLVVVGQPGWRLVDDGLGVGRGLDVDVVALRRPHERFRHAVRLRAAHWRGARRQPDLPCEAPGVPGGVWAAVVAEPLDGLGQAVSGARRWRP